MTAQCPRAVGRIGVRFTDMAEYTFTAYFEEEVLRKRPYLEREW